MYFTSFLIVPVILAVISVFIVILVGCCVIEPGKIVGIIFPYIRRNGNNTLIFGFVFKKYPIDGIFLGVCWIIFEVIYVFCANILITYKNNNNPFSATSIELQCFYDNDTIAELTAIERQEQDEDVHCFAINFNIEGAMGQATGALAMRWIIMSVLTWIVLNVNYTVTQHIKKSKGKFRCYQWFLLIIMVIIILTSSIVLLYLKQPKNIVVIFIIIGIVPYIFNTDIEKEPKSLEEHCREAMKMKTELQQRKAIKTPVIKISKHNYLKKWKCNLRRIQCKGLLK